MAGANRLSLTKTLIPVMGNKTYKYLGLMGKGRSAFILSEFQFRASG